MNLDEAAVLETVTVLKKKYLILGFLRDRPRFSDELRGSRSLSLIDSSGMAPIGACA